MGPDQDKLIAAIAEAFGGVKKQSKEVATLTVESKGVEKTLSEFEDLNKAIEKYNTLVANKKNNAGLAKYFGSEEKMISNLKAAWNSYVKDYTNGVVDINDLSKSNSAKLVLRNANALEALYGRSSYENISKEMTSLIDEMRSMDKFAEGKQYNASIGHFKAVLPIVKEINDLMSANEFSAESRASIFEKLGLSDLNKVKEITTSILELGDAVRKAQQETGSATGTGVGDAMAEEAEQTEEAAERTRKAYESVEEIRSRAYQKYKKKNIEDDWDYNQANYSDNENIDRDAENRITHLQDVLSKLIQGKRQVEQEIEDDIEKYTNHVDNQNDSKVSEYADYLSTDYEQLQRYGELIEYVNKQLSEATLNFKPGDSWGAEEIAVLVQLLQDLVKTIQDVSKAFGNIDDEAGITPLLSQLSTIGDTINNAFNTGNIDKFTSSLEEMSGAFDQIISKLNQISTKEAVYNISVQKGDTGLGTDSVAEQEWAREYQKMLNAYNRIFAIAKKNGLNNQEAISSLYNSKDVTDALYGVDALSKYNLSGIQASSNLRDRIKAMVEFFNYLNMAQKEIAEADAWDKAHGYATEDNNVKQFLNETSRYMRNSDAVTGSYTTVEERVNRRLNKRNAQDINLDQIQKDLQNQEDEATELSTIIEKLETSFKELQNVFKQGFGISDDTESVNYLEKLSAKMEEVASTAKELSEALSGAMNKSGKEVVDGGVKEKVQEALDEGSVYPIKVGLDPTTSLSDQVQEALSSGDYKIKVKGELADEEETKKPVGTQTEQHHSVSRERADGSIVTDSKTTTSNPTPTPTPSLSANTIGNSADGARGSVQALTGDVQKLGSALTEAGAEAGKVNANLAKAQEYDSDEMARRAQLIQEEEENYSNSLTDANIKSIQRMYDSHDNLVQSIITTVKTLENEDGQILEQLDHYQIKWDGKGNALYGSRMTSDDYQKYFGASDQSALEEAIRQNREYEEQERGYQEERARLIAEGKRQEREQSSRDSSWAEMERKKEVAEAKELEQIEQQRLKTIEKRKSEEKKLQETQNKQINKAQEDAWKEQERQRQKQEEEDNRRITRQAQEEARIRLQEEENYQKERARLIAEGRKQEEAIIKQNEQREKEYERLFTSQDRQSQRKTQADAEKTRKDSYVSELNEYDKARRTYEMYKGREYSGKTLSSTETSAMEAALKTIQQTEEQWNKSKSDGIDLASKQADIEKELASAAQERASRTADGKLTEEILEQNAAQKEAIKLRDSLAKKISNMYDQSEWRADSDKWRIDVKNLENSLDALDPTLVKNGEELDNFRKKLREIAQDRQNLAKSSAQQPIGQDWQNSALANLNKWMDQNKIAAKAYREELLALRDAIADVGSKGGAEDWNAQFQFIQAQAADKGLLGKSLGDRFKDQFKNTMTSLATYYLSFQDFIRYGREAISVVTELDTQLTEMRKVSNESLQTLQQYQLESFDIADRVGTTAAQIQSSTADWLRLGKNLPEAANMAEISTKLLNVSEFTDIKDATDALVSATQAYTDVTASDIVDKLNLIGNNFAVSTDELAQGLQNAGAVLKTQGNDLDQTLALLTAGNLIGQDMSKASAGIRTIALRISGKFVPEHTVMCGHAVACRKVAITVKDIQGCSDRGNKYCVK